MSDKNTCSVNSALWSLAARSFKRFVIGIGIEFIGIVALGAIRSHSTDLMNTISQGLFGLSPQDAIGAVLVIVLVAAYVELYLEWGSRKITWAIEKKLDPNLARGSRFLYGYVSNDDAEIRGAHVQIKDVKDENGKKMFADMDLQLRGGLGSHAVLDSGGFLAFDIAEATQEYPGQVGITGMLNNASCLRILPVGSYTFMLRLVGSGFRWRDYRVKVKITNRGGQEAIEILGEKDLTIL